MSLFDRFVRTSKGHCCPICAKPDWCLLSRENPSDPDLVICKRVESPTPWRGAGFLHVRQRSPQGSSARVRVHTIDVRSTESLVALHDAAVRQADGSTVQFLADRLGVLPTSLARLEMGVLHVDQLRQLGFEYGTLAWTFPMRDARRSVIGLRLRFPNSRKLAVKGSRNGIFVPSDMGASVERLFVAEGESDTAALLDLGVNAIGRPGCDQGVELTLALSRGLCAQEIVVVTDADAPGHRGAHELAGRLAPRFKAVRVVTPPAGIKDAREWRRRGLTREQFDQAVEEAIAWTVRVRSRSQDGCHAGA